MVSDQKDQSGFLARNPQVNQQRVEKTREMLRRVRELGIARSIGQTPPFRGRPGAVRDDRPHDESRLFEPIPALDTD